MTQPANTGLPQTSDTSLQQYWAVQDTAYQKLVMMGFSPLNRPDGEFPHITVEDYEKIEGAQYTQIMATVDIWFSYANDRYAWLEGQVIALEEELKDAERELRKQYRDHYASMPKKDRPTESEIKDAAMSFPRCREIRRLLAELNTMTAVIKARIAACERLASGLSRQVTLRGQSIELGGRVGGRPPQPFGR